jgi:hypothetical protein
VVSDTVILAHGEFLILCLAITLVISSLGDASSTGLQKRSQKIKAVTYVILLQPSVTLNRAARHEVITRVDPVTLGISSGRVPLSGYLQEFLDRV